MDIKFACQKCGQHLVIDEGGAGLTIQCPYCGVNLSVPKPVPPSPPPIAASTSYELLIKCRALAHELRVVEAIQMREAVEKARAKEKGYQYTENAIDYDAALRLLDHSKWALSRALRNLTVQDSRAILGALISSRLVGNAVDELFVVTLGMNMSWPALDEWFWRFKQAGRWPSKWEAYPVGSGESPAEFYGVNLNRPTDPLLAKIHSGSLNARRMLLDGWLGWTRPERTRLTRPDFDLALEELIAAGFASRCDNMPLAERLNLLPISSVRAIQKAQSVKGARSKDEIISKLIAAVSPETLAACLRADSYVKLDVGYRQIGRYWFEYARAKLLADTLLNMGTVTDASRNFKRSQLTKIGLVN
jgi:DNA-directed RNA polymerase subunit RPC12/RpoP